MKDQFWLLNHPSVQNSLLPYCLVTWKDKTIAEPILTEFIFFSLSLSCWSLEKLNTDASSFLIIGKWKLKQQLLLIENDTKIDMLLSTSWLLGHLEIIQVWLLIS